MAKEVRRLGRGLSSLLSVQEPVAQAPATAPLAAPPNIPTTVLPVSQLHPNPYQPRRDMGEEELKSLVESIRTSGILQPIIVRRRQGGDGYEIIAGERRWRAAQRAGLTEVPVVVREATDGQMLELALVENIFRENLNAIERAAAYQRYCDEFKLSADEVATRLGEDRSTVANYIRLLSLPEEVKGLVREGKLSMGHARCLLSLRTPQDIAAAAAAAVAGDLSVRALEKLVQQWAAARAKATQPPEPPADTKRPQIKAIEDAFTRALGMKVNIRESRRKGRGKIVIHYGSLAEFDQVMRKLDVEVE